MARDTDPRKGDPFGRLIYELGGIASEKLFGVAEEEYEETMKELAGADGIVEVTQELRRGAEAGLDLAERRRTLREHHERELGPPAYDTVRVENEDLELVGVRVIVSDPDAVVYIPPEEGSSVLLRAGNNASTEIDVPFPPKTIERVDSGAGVAEFVVRAQPPRDDDRDDLPEFEEAVGEDEPEESSAEGGEQFTDDGLDAGERLRIDYQDAVKTAIKSNTETAKAAFNGDGKAVNKLVGEVLSETGGEADPQTAAESIQAALPWVLDKGDIVQEDEDVDEE